MKKTLIAIALAAMIAPAWGAEVVSSNIVGYQRMELDQGYNMVGIQFVEVGTAADKGLSTAAILDSSMAGFDADGNYDTQMMVWRNGNYLPTFGWSGSSGTDVLDDSTLDNKWLNLDLEEEDEELAPSDAVWIKAGSAGTVTISGQVPEGTMTVNLSPGYNMVANPFPHTVKIADFGVLSANMPGFDADGNYDTQMMVWKDGNYLPTFGWSGTSGTDVLDDSSLDNKWLNLDLEETDDTVDFGHGVWIKTGSSGTITFNLSAE